VSALGGEDRGLRRDIGLAGAAFLAFNGIVGAGIFGLPGTLNERFGTFAPWLFPIFALLILAIALPFARLAALHRQSGGPVAYTAAFGRPVAFQAGWLYYLARTSAVAANANIFATYAATLWTPLGTPLGRGALILLLVGALTCVNIVGVRRALRALDALTLLKALPLVGLAIWGLAAAADGIPPPGPPPPLSAIEASALLLLYAFVGFENVLVPASETERPERTIPRALIGTIVATAALYFLIQLAYSAIVPAGPPPEAQLAAFAGTLAGPAGGLVLTIAALASVAGNIGSTTTSTPRVTFALAEQGALPKWFGRVSPRFATPANSILFMGIVAAGLALPGRFEWLAILSTLARLIVYVLCLFALIRIVRGFGACLFVLPGLAVCGWAAAQSPARSWAMLAGALVVGALLYALARRQAGASSAATVSSIQPPPSTRSPS
jgi:APA family basic amino acid/polyamine antiporter